MTFQPKIKNNWKIDSFPKIWEGLRECVIISFDDKEEDEKNPVEKEILLIYPSLAEPANFMQLQRKSISDFNYLIFLFIKYFDDSSI